MGTVAQGNVLGVDLLGNAAMKETCATCMWWSQDDEGGDEDATCVQRLNNPTIRVWRTDRDFSCDLWRSSNPSEPPQ